MSKFFRGLLFIMGCFGIYHGYTENSWLDLVAGALVVLVIIISFNE